MGIQPPPKNTQVKNFSGGLKLLLPYGRSEIIGHKTEDLPSAFPIKHREILTGKPDLS